jgi:hypothetical protein
MRGNYKKLGEKGVNVSIGELAKWDIQVAFPLSDNLPFDLILIYNGKLYRSQVKSGQKRTKEINKYYSDGTISFKLTSNNWYSKTITKYTQQDIDLMILCDYERIYLLSPKEFSGKTSFIIRTSPSKNKQIKCINLAENFIISEQRIKEVLT